MNKKLLSIIVIIGLISFAKAAEGDAMACADTTLAATFGIAQCSTSATAGTANTPSATGGAANCLAGYGFVWVAVSTSKCVACDGNAW